LIHEHRRRQLLDLMAERGWNSMLLYGHAWRKENFRCLVDFNFTGPYAAACLNRAGEVTVALADAWDHEAAPGSAFEPDLARFFARSAPAAVAGLEFAEQRFVDACPRPPVSATADVEELRRVKTPEEIAILRRAAALADRGYQRFVEAIEPGMCEYELAGEVEGFLKEEGAEHNFMLIASGGTEVTGMKPPTERRFQTGDAVTTELTPQIGGYYAQICRTLVLGRPSAAQQESFAIFQEAQQAALAMLRPGVTAAAVARAQNDVFRKYGYGEYTGPRYTRVRGHCLGLFPDETPHVLEEVEYTLQENMVMIVHPNTYLPLAGYMVYGDSLRITATGNEVLNATEKKLFVKA
jgi:Xaa-Pro dipeptidase